jgi:uncharacterized SAM-binding protein YcdF (DUF218 family)
MKVNSPSIKSVLRKLLRFAKALMMVAGIIFTLMIALSLTDKPFWIYYWLGTSRSQIEKAPDYIVVMGGGGMPGGEGMMRCYYAAAAADSFPQSHVIIALPADVKDFGKSDSHRMFTELIHRGVDSARISFETKGTNTVMQARNIAGNLMKSNSILIVTSPEHMLRSVLTFKKAGFEFVGGWPAFETALDFDLLLTKAERTEKLKTPQRQVSLRYNMWNYLKYEIITIREFFALAYYKVMGYI